MPATFLHPLTGFKSPSAASHFKVSLKTSEWQADALRGVHTFLCTTHHASSAGFTLKVRPNDRRCIYDRFGLTSPRPLLWNPGIFLRRRNSLSVSCSVQQEMYAYSLFSTHASMSLFLNDFFFFSSCHSDTYRFTLRPLCLFITSTSHFLIFSPSPSLSINQSWAAPAD